MTVKIPKITAVTLIMESTYKTDRLIMEFTELSVRISACERPAAYNTMLAPSGNKGATS
jgi:hypothetical protein